MTVGVIFSRSNTRLSRQKPTRMPYSCQLQFGWSGSIGWPCGGVITMRAIGREMSQCSSDISGQRISRSPSGSFSGGRPSIGEKARRSCGCMEPPKVHIDGKRGAMNHSCQTLSSAVAGPRLSRRVPDVRNFDHVALRGTIEAYKLIASNDLCAKPGMVVVSAACGFRLTNSMAA